MQKKSFLPFLFLLFLIKTSDSYSQGEAEATLDSSEVKEQHRFGFIDINGYYDTRKASTLSINYLAILNKKLAYFSFINYQQSGLGDYNKGGLTNLDFFYTEHNLTYTISKKLPFDLNFQMVMLSLGGTGFKSTKFRLAPALRVHDVWGISPFFKKIHLNWGINFHIVQFGNQFPLDDFKWQIEHFYRLEIAPKLTKNRIYISGFADHTFGGPMSAGLVMEHQLGVRIYDQFYAVAEYRHFSYYPDPYKDGVGLGLQYLILFK